MQKSPLASESLLTIREHLDRIGRKILIMSGTPGAGKTTLTVQLAEALANRGCRIGVLDLDLKKPEVAKQFGVSQSACQSIRPNLLIAGTACAQDKDTCQVVENLLVQTDWGDLDFLLIDSPWKVSDEHRAICKYIPELTGVIIVTSAQDRSMLDVARSTAFCRDRQMAVLGIVENMSGKQMDNTQKGAWKARKVGAPFLGSLALNTTDEGAASFHEALTALALMLEKQVACSQGETRHV